MIARDYRDAMEREALAWPGVRLSYGCTKRHQFAVLTFRGAERFIMFPTSGSDHRGPANNIAEMRAILRDLGAVRVKRARREGPPRTRCPEPRAVPVPAAADAPCPRDPWGPLRGLVDAGRGRG